VTVLEAILLGVVQGLSEFLPISSSGHLALAMHLAQWRDPPLIMSLVVHLGTLGAVLAVYGRDLGAAIVGGLRLVAAVPRGEAKKLLREDAAASLALAVVVATVPTAAVALALGGVVEHATTSPRIVGVLLTACGAMLVASRWIPSQSEPLTLWRALVIGVAQGVAALPGISRSGTTIVVGLALGLKRDDAARFSFVASVPAIVGAAILEIDLDVVTADGGSALAYGAAALAAFVVGYAALRALVTLVRRGALWWFGLYLIPAGVVAAVFIR
jgi:undecaprenyl-diphosphatase